MLAHYGPETKEARSGLHRSVTAAIERFWPTDSSRPAVIDPKASPVEALYDKIEELSPQSEAQRSLQIQALTLALDLARLRLLLFEQLGSSILVPFLAVLVFWLCIIFASFGLFAPRNGTVIAVLCVCALSVSGAIFLILELDRSFEGLLAEFAKTVGAAVIVRGLRAVSDFEYEFQMALMNRNLAPKIETVFLVPAFDLTYLSSSLVREVARFGGDVSPLVHPAVQKALKRKFAK